MKKVFNIMIVSLALIGIVSCEKDMDSNPVLKDPTTFVLNLPSYATQVYDLKHSKTLEFTTSQPDYGYPAPTSYEVQISYRNQWTDSLDFKVLPSTYKSARMDVSADELNLAMVQMWQGRTEDPFPLEPQKLFVRLKASLAQSGKGEITSNVIQLDKVLAYYQPEPVILPEMMHIMGTICDWDWPKSFKMVQVWYGDGPTNGLFWSMQYFDGSAKIKFNAEKKWDGNEVAFFDGLCSAETIEQMQITTDSDNNICIGASGWYVVLLKAYEKSNELTYSLEFKAPNVYLMGSAVGGWDIKDENKFAVPEGKGDFVSPAFSANTSGDGGLRMCIKLDGQEWWHAEFVVLNEEVAYRGNGNDQERAQGMKGQQAHLNFLTGAGSIK